MKVSRCLPAAAVLVAFVAIWFAPQAQATFGIIIRDGANAILASTTADQTTGLALGAAGLTAAGIGLGFLLPFLLGLGRSQGGGGGGSYGAHASYGTSSSYGAPSYGGGPSYGAPSSSYGGGGSSYEAPSPSYGGGSAGGGASHGHGGSGGGGASYGGSGGGTTDSYGAPAAPSYGAPSSGYNRRYGFASRHKRSAIENSFISANVEALFEMMARTDPEDCYRRLVCDLATGKADGYTTKPILNLLNDQFDEMTQDYLKPTIRHFQYELRLAKKFGQRSQSMQQCEQMFHCPVSGYEIDKLVANVRQQQKAMNALPEEKVYL